MSRSKDDPSFKEIMDEMGAAAKRLADALIDMMKTLMEHQEKQRSEQLKTLMKKLKEAGYEQSPENAEKLQAHLDKIAENKTRLAEIDKELTKIKGMGPRDLMPKHVQMLDELQDEREELLQQQKELLLPENAPDLAIDEVAVQLKNRNAQGQQAQAPEAIVQPEPPAAAVNQPPAPAPGVKDPKAQLVDDVEPADDLSELDQSIDADMDYGETLISQYSTRPRNPIKELVQDVKFELEMRKDQAKEALVQAKDDVKGKIKGAKEDIKGKIDGAKNALGDAKEKIGQKIDAVGDRLNPLKRINKPGSNGETWANQLKALKGGISEGMKQAQNLAHKAVHKIGGHKG